MKGNALCVTLVTAGSPKEGRAIAKAILKAKLAACVNIIPGIESHYWWQGRLEHAREYLLIIKTAGRHFMKLSRLVKQTHSYQTPEIIAVALSGSETNYATWWRDSLAGPSQRKIRRKLFSPTAPRGRGNTP